MLLVFYVQDAMDRSKQPQADFHRWNIVYGGGAAGGGHAPSEVAIHTLQSDLSVRLQKMPQPWQLICLFSQLDRQRETQRNLQIKAEDEQKKKEEQEKAARQHSIEQLLRSYNQTKHVQQPDLSLRMSNRFKTPKPLLSLSSLHPEITKPRSKENDLRPKDVHDTNDVHDHKHNKHKQYNDETNDNDMPH